jgi:cation diffusion facilitator CzcD-associated flavoprotein CzcO
VGHDRVCVIGAGCSGLAALKELTDRNLDAVCIEQGSDVGGNWRYQNDSGLSGAYASLRTNVSRAHMQYRCFPMAASCGDFPHHSAMAEYLAAFARAFDLRRSIRFSTRVERAEPLGGGSWRVAVAGGPAECFAAVVVASGHHWDPRWPELPGTSTAAITHAHAYRTPDAFAGTRVLVIGAGQSAVEIATEVCGVAARTILSVRRGAHVLPRRLFGSPFDRLDLDVVNRLPWRLLNRIAAALASASRADDVAAHGFPRPAHRLLEQIPTVSSELGPALRSGVIAVRPEVRRLDGTHVEFTDGSVEAVDRIVCATGYRITFPFLPPSLLTVRGTAAPLYRRIVPPDLPGLYFIGLVDAPGGLLPLVERQSAWLADVLTGRLELPPRAGMLAAIDAGEPRSKERFPLEPPHSIRTDPHAYLRLLASDRRRARRRPKTVLAHRTVAAPGRLPAT